jgi:hypothetical protein
VLPHQATQTPQLVTPQLVAALAQVVAQVDSARAEGEAEAGKASPGLGMEPRV